MFRSRAATRSMLLYPVPASQIRDTLEGSWEIVEASRLISFIIRTSAPVDL